MAAVAPIQGIGAAQGLQRRIPGLHRLAPREARLIFKALLPYALFGILWILVADRLAVLLFDPYQVEVFEAQKGWIFVATSLFLIYLLVRGEQIARVRSEMKFRAAFATTPDPMGILRLADGTFVEVNDGFRESFGYARDELPGRSPMELGLWRRSADARKFEEALRASGEVRELATRFHARDGTTREVIVSGRSVRIRDHQYVVFSARDVTEQRAFEARLERQAGHDHLTDLPNRLLLLDRLEHALAQAERGRERVGVLNLNLDRFRVINDTLGLAGGDRVLKEVAERLTGALRQSDTVARPGGTVGRMGGDEFTMVLAGLSGDDDLRLVVDRILERFREPLRADGREVSVSVSIGAAVSTPGSEERADDLLSCASIALDSARTSGSEFRVFDPEKDAGARRRRKLESDLHGAAGRGELELRFQPIVCLRTGRTERLESLVRWRHPELGMLSPADFIPVAEASGEILPVGEWVLRESARRMQIWNEALPRRQRPLITAVNVSARELQEPEFPGRVARILEETGLLPEHLELEITESLLMHSLAALHSLQAMRLHLAIDDFGTGYSSLAYLSRLPVKTIKIDRAFIGDFEKNPEATAIVRAVIAIARALDLTVVAEGIETRAQLDRLRSIGCGYGQGYLFSRPLADEGIEALLRKDPRW